MNDVKDYLKNNLEALQILLESLNCRQIWTNGKEVRSTIPDGNNNTSVSVNIETLFSSIYSQNFYGDIISLVAHFESCSWKDAMKYCRNLFGLRGSYKKTTKTIDLLADFKGYATFKENEEFKIENIKIYGEDKLWDFIPGLHKSWLNEGITPETAERYNLHYDNKRERILIPHYNFHDKNALVGIQARSTIDDFTREMLGIPKFLNYIPNYKKNWNLFGFSHNIAEINKRKMVLIFESEKAVLQLSTYGLHIGVATGSHILTKERVDILLQYTDDNVEIVFCWDNDVSEQEVLQACNKLTMFRRVSYITGKIRDEQEGSWYWWEHDLLGLKQNIMDAEYKIWKYLLEERMAIDEY